MLNSKGGAKMNRKLSYNGKTIQEMTKWELQEQYEKNKKRMVRSILIRTILIKNAP